eukprot:TRINITY_DN6586_c0_g1_i2.p1 TRINITY_DN6586_c0_g1~~TRINITY_DN6586_c0_g1_i2.p1  ORF type:complete len:534 (-),score=57.64 TRINITY_DN6586_c0_g1_i2:133-1734(-)
MEKVIIFLLACGLVASIDNGLGVSPPMGWRSWNCFGGNVNDPLMRQMVDCFVDRSRTVNGVPTSLLDVGYITVGLDDNWQACNSGVNNSFHDSQGNPLINLNTFPDMKGMCDYAHSKGTKMGWYHNNCICSENQKWDSTYQEEHYEGDVNAIVGYGFDEVKLDGCGEFLDLDTWADLLNATGRPVLIENCHWGGTVPTLDWCPFNYFRTSGDISASWTSFFNNLQTVVPYTDYNNPLSRPGCWAYPDMLEVGNIGVFAQEQAHFGAWVVVSAPLILGFNLSDQSTMDRVWPIITNTEAITISQTWAGHPGMLVKSWNPNPPNDNLYLWAVDCDSNDKGQYGFSYNANSKTVSTPNGLCLDAKNTAELVGADCSGSSTQQWNYNSTSGELKTSSGSCMDINNFQGPEVEIWGCNGGCNQQFNFNSDGSFSDRCSGSQPKKCLSARTDSPVGGNLMQIWAKPQPKGAVACLVLNSDQDGPATVVQIDLSSLNITGSVNVRDLWLHKDLGVAKDTFTTDAIPGYDSRFYLFTPTTW